MHSSRTTAATFGSTTAQATRYTTGYMFATLRATRGTAAYAVCSSGTHAVCSAWAHTACIAAADAACLTAAYTEC